MKVTDPSELISKVDLERWNSLRGVGNTKSQPDSVTYLEPNSSPTSAPTSIAPIQKDTPTSSETEAPKATDSATNSATDSAPEQNILKGKIQRLEDYIDTDAVCHNRLTSKLSSIIMLEMLLTNVCN